MLSTAVWGGRVSDFSKKVLRRGTRAGVDVEFPEKGPFKCYVTQMGVGGVKFSGKKRYEGVRFYVISVTRGRVGV